MTDPQLTVLHSMPAPAGPTRFATQLRDGAPPELSIRFFDWNFALHGQYDVFHAHWPEYLLRARTPWGRLRKRARFRRLLRRLEREQIPVVRTLHNLHPHEDGTRSERRILNVLLDRTDAFVRLNPTSVAPRPRTTVTILHGHYVDQFARYPRTQLVPGRLLNFGLIRPYKNVPALIRALRNIPDSTISLRIVGKPADETLRAEVSALIGATPNASAELEFVDDAALVAEVTAAEAVILPYDEMHNSGTLLVALSLGRPAIVPRSPVNEALQAEVGEGWLFMYEPPFSTDALHDGIAWLTSRATIGASPDLHARDWQYVGAQHLALYRELIAARKDRR